MNHNEYNPWQPYENTGPNRNEGRPVPQNPVPQQPAYTPPPRYVFPMGKKEFIFGCLVLAFSLLLWNSLIYADANLGFAVGAAGILLSTAGYLYSHGHKADWYSAALLVLSLGILGAFPRSADAGMKVLMCCVLLVVPGLSYCLLAGQNLRNPGGISSLLDSFRATFSLGMGRVSESGRGIREACKTTGSMGKTSGAVLLGLLITLPVLVILVPLLMRADAAFEGLLEKLPELRWGELITTLILGIPGAYLYYTRGTALQHMPRTGRTPGCRKGMNALTVNTVLLAVAFVYGVYLVSQLAYFVGGFSGLLPEEYTMAQYARRGFFEMAWLCAINLGLIALSIGLVSPRGKVPALTKGLCLFVGCITLFLVAAASAKMLLYIRAYGLTRLRILTEVFMLWLALTTGSVCIWLFQPKLPYMKFSMVLGLALCAGLMWADVDTQVAEYNVRAYQSGALETVDIGYLGTLSYSAVPYLQELTGDKAPGVGKRAEQVLNWYDVPEPDLRGWNYAKAQAARVLDDFGQKESAETKGS